MSTSSRLYRREFQAGAGTLMIGGSLIVPLTNSTTSAAGKKVNEPDNAACNFQASFMTWDLPYRKDPRPYARHNTPHGNMARIELDAIIDVIDRQSGKQERFVLIAACRAEWVYAEDRLFQLPGREYRQIYSLTQERNMGQRLTDTGQVSRGHPVSDNFRAIKIDVVTYRHSTPLRTSAEIAAATAANRRLVARTRIDDPAGPHSYLLEYPIRTMNFQPKTDSFQVDTGPLLVPDFKSGAQRAVDRLEMAHVAYNRLDRAEFILRRPTPVEDENGKPLCHVLHFSEVREDRVVNEILAVDEA